MRFADGSKGLGLTRARSYERLLLVECGRLIAHSVSGRVQNRHLTLQAVPKRMVSKFSPFSRTDKKILTIV